MAKSLGKDDLLWVESATPGTYNVVKGQGDLKISRSRDKIDLSDKTSSGYKLNAYGLADLTITMDCQPDLPDTNGFTRLQAQCNMQPAAPFKIQIRKGGQGAQAADAIFEASVYGQVTSQDSPQTGARSVGFEFGLAAAPVTDAIS